MDSVRIFNIEDFSVDDGPGLRTVVFFKGCSLRCRWCHNPESIAGEPEILIYDDKCIGCGECFKNCPAHAHTVKAGIHVIDKSLCRNCFKCVAGCYAGALVRAGEDVPLETIEERISSNKEYFTQSGGGVTFSGGECMLQIDGLEKLARWCSEQGVHTAIDTAGNVPWESFERILPYTGMFLYDIKAIDPEVHKKCTGSDNARILNNFNRLIDRGADILVRIPYIPGFNDGELPAIADYLSARHIKAELLGYHTLGNSKYKALRQDIEPIRTPTKDEVNSLKLQYGFI